MAVYSNKKFARQGALLKKKQLHDEIWDELCTAVTEFEDKEANKLKKKAIEDDEEEP